MDITGQYHEFMRWWEGFSHPTQNASLSLSVGSLLVVGVLVLGVWFRVYQGRQHPIWMPILATVMVIALVPLHLHLAQSNYGALDTRCQYYQNGNLTYELLQPPVLEVVDPMDPFSPRVLILLVRATERWGDELHVCQLPERDIKAQQLLASLGEGDWGRGSSGGDSLSFSFGNGPELPNVTFRPHRFPEDKGPPEAPDQDA